MILLSFSEWVAYFLVPTGRFSVLPLSSFGVVPGRERRAGHPWWWQGSCRSGWRPTVGRSRVPQRRPHLPPLPCTLHTGALRWVPTRLTRSSVEAMI